MAKVIQTVLNLKDNMSGGLLNVAKNTQGVTKDMRDATRNVIDFKNKAGTAIKTFATNTAKAFGNTVAKSAKLLTGTVVGLSGSFMALDPLTEEFRTSLGKVNTAFQSVGSDVQTANAAYRELYGVIGDYGATAEAAQHLSSLTTSQQGLVQWTNAAIGVFGKFGDAVPLETLFEAASETSRTGVLTGTLVDAIIRGAKEGERFGVALRADTEANKEWNEAVLAAKTSEDFFNLALQECSSEAERQSLILNFLTNAYGDSANAFKENNSQLIQSNKNQLALSSVMAKLGDSASKVKNTLAGALGVNPDGAIRTGSVFDVVNQNAEKLSNTISGFVANGGAEKLGQMLDKGLVQASEMASSAINYLKDNGKEMFNIFQTGVSTMATSMAEFVQNGSAEKLANMIKDGITKAFELATSAVKYFSENGESLIDKVKILASVFAGVKLLQFGYNAGVAAKNAFNFSKTIFTIAKDRVPKLANALKNTDWNFADRIHNSAMSGLNKTTTVFSNFGKKVATGVSSGVTKAGSAISKFGKSAVSAGKTVATGLGTNIVKAGTAVGQFGKSTISSAGKGLATFGKSAVSVGKTAVTGLGSGIAKAGGAIANFGKIAFGFVSANPIVLAIGAAIAAGVLLWQNWDTVKAFAIGLWDKVKEVFGGIKDSISGAVEIVREKVSGAFNAVKDSIIGAFETVKEKVSGVFSWIDEKIQKIPILGDMYKNTKLVGGWLFDKIGGNAMGTSYWRGGLTAVHERGGEIIDLPSGTRIIPHDISLNMAKDFNSKLATRTVSVDSLKKSTEKKAPVINNNITINGNISDRRYVDILTEQISGRLLQAMENMA